jgi:hypothetical protein
MRVMGKWASARCRGVLLTVCSAALIWMQPAAAQSNYTWHNVRIVAGGFVPGILYHPTESSPIEAATRH